MGKIHVSGKVNVSLNYSTLGEIVTTINELIKEYGPNECLNIETYDDYGSTLIDCYIDVRRLETDEEYTNRLAMEERQKAYRRKSYETLKKEFG